MVSNPVPWLQSGGPPPDATSAPLSAEGLLEDSPLSSRWLKADARTGRLCTWLLHCAAQLDQRFATDPMAVKALQQQVRWIRAAGLLLKALGCRSSARTSHLVTSSNKSQATTAHLPELLHCAAVS